MPKESLNLTEKEIERAFSHPIWAERFPPVLDVNQAAELARVPKSTVYAWSSKGQLRGCARRVGKHLRVFRNRFLIRIFNEGIVDDK